MNKFNTNKCPYTDIETTTVEELRKALRGLPNDAHIEIREGPKGSIVSGVVGYSYSKKESTLTLFKRD